MSVTIPFVRSIEFEYGQIAEVSPRVRRIIANNPGPFTYTGTGVYVIGRGNVAVIDPGPDIPEHFSALKEALAGETITHVFVTHSHMDHSPLAHPLAAHAGAQVYGGGPAVATESEVRMEAGDDLSFEPDIRVGDGDVFQGQDWTIEAITTPGHTSNHICYALQEENALFSGDHVMGWSTTVISPPDGDMGAYLKSLEKIRARNFSRLWPTHGPPVEDPGAFLDAYIAHRRAREAQIVARLRAGQTRVKDIVAVLYADVDKRLHPAACHSVMAHILHMLAEGRIVCAGAPGMDADFRLAG